MSAYRPGRGFDADAVRRLQERKRQAVGIADVPAADVNQQWDRVLGGSDQQKKLRCGHCTRPLSEEEVASKKLVCTRCTDAAAAAAKGDWCKSAACLAHEEMGIPLLYYCQRHALKMTTPAVAAKVSRSNAEPSQPMAQESINAINNAPNEGTGQLVRGTSIFANNLHDSCRHTYLAVLSFNVLAECYVRVEGQPWNAFTYCDDAHLTWEHRQSQILRILQASDADVICLQEVVAEKRVPPGGGPDEWQLPAWTDELQGYTGVLQGLKQKEWDKTAERNLKFTGQAKPTGVATFYRTDRFEMSAASKHGSGSGTTVFLKCRHVAQPGGVPLEVAVANIHLVGSPDKFDEHVKALNSLKKNLGKQDLRIVCGDFNGECEAGTAVADWFEQEGLLEVKTGTSWAEPGKALRLDHIFASPRLKVVAASGDLLPSEIGSGLPCATCPSDHAPVAALFLGEMRDRCPW